MNAREKQECIDYVDKFRVKPEEQYEYRCPYCGSFDWGCAAGVIFCGGCGRGGSDQWDLFKAEADKYFGRMKTTHNQELPAPYFKKVIIRVKKWWHFIENI